MLSIDMKRMSRPDITSQTHARARDDRVLPYLHVSPMRPRLKAAHSSGVLVLVDHLVLLARQARVCTRAHSGRMHV